MDDPFIIFRASNFFQFSDFHKIENKTFPFRFIINKNLLNLPRSKVLMKIKHLKNLFLETVSITGINIFGDLGSGKFEALNSCQFFKFFCDTPKFFF